MWETAEGNWVLFWWVGPRSVSVQSLSRVWLFAIPWTAAHQASLSFTVSRSLFKFFSVESRMLSNHLILCHPLIPLPSIVPSVRVFPNESALCIRWTKYCCFSISPSSEHSGLISFRIDWFGLFIVQGTLNSLSSIAIQKHLSHNSGIPCLGSHQRELKTQVYVKTCTKMFIVALFIVTKICK